MRTQITSVAAFCILASLAHAETAPGPAGRAVPKSVLEELGLGDLVVIPTEDHPADVPDSVPEPREPKVDEPTVAAPSPDKKLTEARKKLVVEATAHVEMVVNKMEMAREAVLKAKSDLALAKQAVSQGTSDLARARRDVEAAQATVEAVNQKIAKAMQRAAALLEEGKEMATVFAAQSDLIARLGPIQKELRKVADKFNDSEVAAAEAGLANVLTGKEEENAKREEALTAKAREFENAKQTLLAARRETEQKQKEVTLAESKWNDVNQRVLAAQSEVERKQNDVALAESLVDELTVAYRAAKDQLRAADLAVKTVADE
ncbi:MAG: hypothetical protein ABIP48_09360 [Planctomycetota bacterium]